MISRRDSIMTGLTYLLPNLKSHKRNEINYLNYFRIHDLSGYPSTVIFVGSEIYVGKLQGSNVILTSQHDKKEIIVRTAKYTQKELFHMLKQMHENDVYCMGRAFLFKYKDKYGCILFSKDDFLHGDLPKV